MIFISQYLQNNAQKCLKIHFQMEVKMTSCELELERSENEPLDGATHQESRDQSAIVVLRLWVAWKQFRLCNFNCVDQCFASKM